MKKTASPLLLLFLLIPITGLAQLKTEFQPKSAQYLWPTDATHYLTSTFGETRAGHFHAALDIKTWGRRGYKVFATRDGIVSRIAIGPRGYGKVIYLKHADGSYSVYAHLLSFNKQLQQLADSIRFAEDYAFEIDRQIENKNIHVAQGDVIGYSGASGIGPPHLHFELRTPSEKPFNPLLTNLKIRDNIPPKIMGISVEPMSPVSSVEGKNAIYVKKSWYKNGQYQLGTINASGPIGLGVDAYDKSNRVHNVYAVYELSMKVDGRELFKARVDSFSYNETGQMFIDRVYPILKKSHEGYQRLYIADGNSLSFYKDRDKSGVLNLPAGKHEVIIRAKDYFGNESTASLTLNIKNQRSEHPDLTKYGEHKTTYALSPNSWGWFHDWATIPNKVFRHLTLGTVDSSAFIRHKNDISVDLKKLDNLFVNIPGIGPLNLQQKNPATGGYITSLDQQDFAYFPPHTFYDTLSVGMSVQKFRKDSIRVDLLPEAYPLQHAYTLHIHKDSTLADTAKLSFYKWNGDDREWELIPSRFSGDYITAEAESLGTFVTLRDTTAPRLKHPRLSKRPDGQWLVMITARDDLSGIDYNRTVISVNGRRGIAEYEPEDSRFVYYNPDFEPSSHMEISVTAFDKMGNKRVQDFYLGSGSDRAKK